MNHSVLLKDGRRLGYSLSGEGNTTVVFENGLGTEKDTWTAVTNRLTDHCQLLTYDRAGFGNSQESSLQQLTFHSICEDLAELLSILDLKTPIVLVGHSFGGLLINYFSQHWPDTIKGMVYVDPSDPRFLARSSEYRTAAQYEYWVSLNTPTADIPLAVKKEQTCLLNMLAPGVLTLHDPELCTRVLVCDNLMGTFEKNKGDCYDATMTPRDILAKDSKLWLKLHMDWQNMLSHSEIIIAEHCGHNIQTEQAELVASSITEVLASIER